MTITLKTDPSQKGIELGGGDCPLVRPNVDVRICYDAEGKPTVDFTADFNEPLPIQSDEFDFCFSKFCIEHISYLKVKQFISEVFRIIKPGGKAVIVTANTEAQVKWILEHPEGWDGKDFFTSASEKLFGSQNYLANFHCVYFSPGILTELFSEAGFVNITTTPYGTRDTDICVQAVKPTKIADKGKEIEQEARKMIESVANLSTLAHQSMKPAPPPDTTIIERRNTYIPEKPQTWSEMETERQGKPMHTVVTKSERGYAREVVVMPREQIFGRDYFDRGHLGGGYGTYRYRDYPAHELSVKYILERNPTSVLDLGCARGYVIKKLQDAGIPAHGIDISQHCFMTRACDGFYLHDLCNGFPTSLQHKVDLIFAINFFEHIPEEYLEKLLSQMPGYGNRGLFGISFGDQATNTDKTKFTLRSKEWWVDMFKTYAPNWPVEIYSSPELENGEFPQDILKGDGKVKLNLGCLDTMYHYGWINCDLMTENIVEYARQQHYIYREVDLMQSLPWQTGSVDLIVLSHVLEHFPVGIGISVLRDCRRVLKPDGLMRVTVPDAELLMRDYAADMKDPVSSRMSYYDHISNGCAERKTAAGKLWEVLHAGHAAIYDWDTLQEVLELSGFTARRSEFRDSWSHPGNLQIRKECIDISPAISCYVNAIPRVG